MQTLNDVNGSLNNPHLYFKYSNTYTEVTHVTRQSLKFCNKPGQVLGANTDGSKQTQLLFKPQQTKTRNTFPLRDSPIMHFD